MTTPLDIVVVTPTYNEKDNLPILAAGILAHPGFRLLVVDDGSPDGTGAVAEDLARHHPGRVEVMHRKGPRGLGRSYVDGLRRALESGADLIFQMDADLSHNPEYLPTMAAAAERYDVVIGSRYLTGVSVVNWPLHRIFLSAFANRYVRAVTRISVADCTSGGPDRPIVDARVAMMTSEQPAMLACPANDGPDSSVTIGTRPDRRGNCTNVVTIPPW